MKNLGFSTEKTTRWHFLALQICRSKLWLNQRTQGCTFDATIRTNIKTSCKISRLGSAFPQELQAKTFQTAHKRRDSSIDKVFKDNEIHTALQWLPYTKKLLERPPIKIVKVETIERTFTPLWLVVGLFVIAHKTKDHHSKPHDAAMREKVEFHYRFYRYIME